jgi:hypothetical protein
MAKTIKIIKKCPDASFDWANKNAGIALKAIILESAVNRFLST